MGITVVSFSRGARISVQLYLSTVQARRVFMVSSISNQNDDATVFFGADDVSFWAMMSGCQKIQINVPSFWPT